MHRERKAHKDVDWIGVARREENDGDAVRVTLLNALNAMIHGRSE